MEEEKELTRHDQLKYRLKRRIPPELFEKMPEELQDYLIELDPADDGTYTIPQDVVDQAEADLEDIYIYAYPVHMVY